MGPEVGEQGLQKSVSGLAELLLAETAHPDDVSRKEEEGLEAGEFGLVDVESPHGSQQFILDPLVGVEGRVAEKGRREELVVGEEQLAEGHALLDDTQEGEAGAGLLQEEALNRRDTSVRGEGGEPCH